MGRGDKMKTARIRFKLGVLAVLVVSAVIWPVAGAAPIPLAAAYLTPADCTKTAATGTHGWNSAATWTPSGVPGTTDVVCIPDGAVVQYDVPAASGDSTVIGIASPVGSGTLSLGFNGTSNLILSGGASVDKASVIGHLTGNGVGGQLSAAKIAGLPHIIRLLDSCGIIGPGDYLVTEGGAGGPCFLDGTGSPTMTLAANITQTGGWNLSNFHLVVGSGITLTSKSSGLTMKSGSIVENQGVIDFNPGVGDNDPAWTETGTGDSKVVNVIGGFIKKSTAGTSGITRVGIPVVNDGTIFNDSPGTLVVGGPNNLSSAPDAVVIGGPVSGTGTISDNVFHDSGALSPGHSAGNMSISGNYTVRPGLNAGPVLAIEVGGTVIGQSDSLSTDNDCTLGGTLSVTLIGGYTPAVNDVITFMFCDSGVFGTFNTESLPPLPPPLFFDVVYGSTTVALQVKAATAVTFRSFTATRERSGVRLRWRTAAETDTLGFNVFREHSGLRQRLNRNLIGSRGDAAGRAYSLLDRHAARRSGDRYWLQVVDRSGVRSWHGPVRPQRG